MSKVSLTFGANSTTVTDALGTKRTYTFQTILGVPRLTGVSQPGGSGCGPTASSLAYDANGNVASRTDFDGSQTTYEYDLARNLEVLRVEVSGTAQARTVSTTWHPLWRKKTAVAEPGRITRWIYNGEPDPSAGGAPAACAAAGAQVIGGVPIAVVCKKIEQATTDANGSAGFAASAVGEARTWTYSYDAYGQVLTEDGPRTDVADVTTYEYWSADVTCPGAGEGTGMDKGCRGQLKRVTNAAGHVTDYLQYNAHGQLMLRREADGIEHAFTYDARRRLTSRSEGGRTTSYQYDPRGLPTRITAPDGSFLDYAYDDAHRLVGIADAAGNTIAYTLDAAGNRLDEAVKDAGGVLGRAVAREFDALSRIKTETLGAAQ